jgi:hypothetical protein
MENVGINTHLTEFEFEGQKQRVSFIETMNVVHGVKCDVYRFDSDDSKDLGIIKIEPNCKTPLQKVLKGNKTIEGYVSGEGKLIVSTDGKDKTYPVKDGEKFSVDVRIGETMQWQAGEKPLVAYEICFPPYEDGRYENLT